MDIDLCFVDFFLQHQGLFHGFVHTGFPPIARSLDDTEAVTRPINAFGLFSYVCYEHMIAGEDKRANKNSSILRLSEGREAVDMLDISGSRGTTFIRCYLSVATSLGTCDMYVMSCRSSTYPITGITGKVYFQRT